MKVRLKQAPHRALTFYTQFQFHEGPIKTVYSECDEQGEPAFQFHEGPIKTLQSTVNVGGNQVSIPWRSD